MSNNLIGATLAEFTATLSAPVDRPVDVAWSTRDGTAKAGTHYEAANGVITFLPGETVKKVSVSVYAPKPMITTDKNFYIELSPPSNAVLATTSIEVVISLNSEGGVSILELVLPQGKRGLKGDPGLSAYEHAVLSGRFEGTEQEWLDEELRAGKAAQQAEAAATSATIAGKVYLTPAEGVNPSTGVPVGAYFNVRSTANNSMVDEYKNVNGIATPTGKSYPSAHKLNQTIAETQQSLSQVEQSLSQIEQTANQAIASTQIYRDQSMSFANQAEAAATAATIGGKVYNIPEAGVDPVTGVADGAYYNVRSPSDESYVDEYQNVGGVATATGKSYPSLVGVDARIKKSRLKSINELLAIEGALGGDRYFVQSHYQDNPEFLGNGWYVYDPNQAAINNGGTIINGWVLIPENNTITPYHFGWTGRDLAADMEAFQKCFDAVKHGQTIRFWHTSRLEKQVGKHTDIYGSEGRSLGRLTLNGGQPCLILRAKKNVTVILDSAELYTETACQGILDLYKCHRCKVISGTLTGGNYIRETKEYKFPPIDGTTGRAEKGYSAGFNTTVLSPDIGGMGNNMVVTQYETSGGYGGQFPQFDGTTAPTWGVWRGGQLGNHSEGIRVIGGFGNEILGTEIHGFNGSGIRLGRHRSLDGSTNYPRISNPESRAITPKGTKIRGTYLHNCYIGGCQSDRSIDTYFNDYNVVEDMGHPDASVAHDYVDPGYGFATSRAMPNFKIHINHNAFTNCFRKGIDCHQGSQLHIEKNSIKGTMFHGIGIAVDDDYADIFYQPYLEHVGIIKDNEIESHDVGIFYANGEFGRGRRETAKKQWEQLHVNITGNVIRSTNPFFYNFAHSPFYIANNTFIFAAPYAHQKPVTGNKAGIYIGSYAGRGFTSGDVISHNKFFNSKDGNFAYGVFVENGSKQTKAIKITENHFDISRWYQKHGADSMYVHNDVTYRSGASTIPILFGGTNMPQDMVVENNTVWDDFNHELVALYAGGGSGLIAYPLINGHGRVTGIQLFDGGSGYSPSTVFSLRSRGRSAGVTLNATIVDGVVTDIQVTNAGRFYRSSYGLTIPRGLVSYDMRHVSGSSCYDKGIGSSTDTGCVLSVIRTDMTPPITPFSIESGVRWMNTTKEGQYAIHSGGVRGGTLSFWIEVSSTTSAGERVLALSVDSLDESSSAAISILANVSTTGFTVSGVYVDGVISSGQDLSFDTPYLITLSSSALSGSSILFGSNAGFTDAFLDAKYAFIELHRGYTYSADEVSDLFEMRRSVFGK